MFRFLSIVFLAASFGLSNLQQEAHADQSVSVIHFKIPSQQKKVNKRSVKLNKSGKFHLVKQKNKIKRKSLGVCLVGVDNGGFVSGFYKDEGTYGDGCDYSWSYCESSGQYYCSDSCNQASCSS